MLKRFLATLLALVLVVSCLPLGVLAEGATEAADLAALKAVFAAGGEVKLTSDVELTEKVTVSAGKTVVLDLNGKTISSTNEGYFIENAGNLTIKDSREGGKDGEVKMTPASESGTVSALKNTGTLTINGGKFTTTTKSKTAQAIYSESPSVTINGGTFEANHTGTGASAYTLILKGNTSGSSVATINGGTFISKSNSTGNTRCATIYPNCKNDQKITITINGGTFESERKNTRTASVIYFKDGECGATVVINGGTFSAKTTETAGTDDRLFAASTGSLTINGGTFTYDTKVFTDTRKATITGGTFVKWDGTKNDISTYVKAEGYTQAADGIVAKHVATSEELVAAMEKGGNIRLADSFELTAVAKVPAGVTATLDLNGKTISSTSEVNHLENEGTLTIVDSREGDKDGEVKVVTTTDAATVIALKNTGTLTVDGGKFTASGKVKTVYTLYSVAPSVTINGGTFTASQTGGKGTWGSSSALALNGDGSADPVATINGGTFVAENATPENNRCAALYAGAADATKITITINGGTFEGKRTNARSGSAIRFRDKTCSTVVVINGGTFAADMVSGNVDDKLFANTFGSLTIKGGTFTYDGGVFTAERKATITGGTFVKTDGTKNDIGKYVTEGYEQAANGQVVEKAADPGHSHKLCGDATCADHTALTFEEWTSTTTLPDTAGNYYLTEDVQLQYVWNLKANVNLCLNGHTITAPANERTVALNAGYTLSITDCGETGKITGGVRNYGGVINVNAGATFNLYGGSLTGNKAKDNNGNGQSGAVYLSVGSETAVGGTFNMYGGSIDNNTAYNGGAIYACKYSVINMFGGEITGNTATNGSGAILLSAGCTFNMTGGSITGNTSAVDGGAITTTSAIVSVSGKAVITDNKAGDVASNVYMKGTGLLKVGTLDATAKIGVSVSAPDDGYVLSSALGGANVTANFVSDNEDYEIAIENDKLVLDEKVYHKHNLNDCNAHDADVNFLPWESTTTLPTTAGNYYLTGNVQLGSVWNLKANVNLCLNGFTITAPANERTVALNAGYTLSITDHNNTGKITGGVRNYGGVINVNAGATFNLYGGQLTGNKTKDNNGNGQAGAVYLSEGSATAVGGTFNMYGGSINNNTAYNGGAIYACKYSVINMFGGEITGNTATNGSGVALLNLGSTFNMTGGSITGNTSAIDGGAITTTSAIVSVSGKAVITDNKAGNVISNVYMKGTGLLNVGALDATAKIGVSVSAPDDGYVLSSALGGADVIGNFISDNDEFEIKIENDVLCLSMKSTHVHDLDNCNEHDDDVKFQAWKSTTTLPSVAGSYYLTADVQLKSVWNLKANVNLCLNGYTITAPANERSIALNAGYTLTITDHQDLGKITGGVRNWGGVINVNAGATFNLYGGQLTGNTNKTPEGGDGQGGAVYLSTATDTKAGGVFNMYGGSINNNVAYRGGAVYMTKGSTFNMYGGIITENTAINRSGAVFATGATFNLYDGEIVKNTGKSTGGAISMMRASTMTMDGGKINYNEGTSGGAVILESDGTKFVMNGGEFIGNSGSYGAALYVSTGTTFEMNGGLFAENNARKSGGAMCLQSSTTTINNCEIKNNTSKEGGGAINLYDKAVLTINGGTFTGNTGKQGGALCISGKGTFNLNGGLITKNKSTGAGGGIILLNTGTKMTMTGGEISHNNGSTGGGIFVSTRTEMEMTGGKITYNTVKKHGGGIAMLLSKVTIRGGIISYNVCTDRDAQGAGIKLDGGTLNIHNVTMDGNQLTHKLNSGGTAIASYKGTETSNGVTKVTNSVINLYGGTIMNHTGRSGGTVQLLTETTFNMYGGTIRNSEAVLDGGAVAVYSKSSFNMYGGLITNSKSAKAGGGIYYGKGCTGVLTDVTLYGAECGTDGGFLHAYGLGTKITMKNVKIYGCKAGGIGGGMAMMMESDLDMDDCELYDNTAKKGGGMALSYKTTGRIDNCKIYNNTTTETGGGMYLEVAGCHYFTNVEVTGNTAGTSGGGILTRGDITFTDCLIDGNTAAKYGGGICTSSAWTYDNQYTNGYIYRGQGLILENTTVSNNTAAEKGGGAYLSKKNWNAILDSTFTGNTAQNGSALYVMDDLKVVGLTATGNTAQAEDGYAVWYDNNRYDGVSYIYGIYELGGDVIIKDNKGAGGVMLCENVVLSNVAEGYGEKTEFGVTLSDGILTNRILGEYNYEGGNLNYTVTYGTRSYDEPEIEVPVVEETEEATEATESEIKETQDDSTGLYIGIGAIAGVIVIAAVILVIAKKKKSPAGKE